MKIKVNQDTIDFANDHSINDLLVQLNMNSKSGIAIAVNQQIISKNHWTNTTLKENDSVTIITATQGG